MLDGSFTAKVDPKGRVKIPSEFRRQIQEEFGTEGFYVTSVRGDYGRIYPTRSWQKVTAKLARQPPSRPQIIRFRRATSYFGQMAAMDQQGRILLHPRLRNHVGLKDEVLIVGQPTHLEVWNLKKFKVDLEVNPVTDQDEDYIATLEDE